MQALVHVITADRRLEQQPIACVDLNAKTPVWVDVCECDPEMFTRHLAPFGLQTAVFQAISATQKTPQVATYHDAVLLQLPVAQKNSDPAWLSIVVVGQTFVTIHQSAIPAINRFVERFRETALRTSEMPSLLLELLDYVVEDSIRPTLSLRDAVDQLEQLLDTVSDEFDPEAVSSLRRLVVTLEGLLDDQYHCIGGLHTLPVERFSVDGIEVDIRYLLTRLEHSIRAVGRLADRLSALQQRYMLLLEERQNEKLHVLTIVSAVFLPLMLIAGVYGMNFSHMPELQWRFGYPLIIGLMTIIAAALVWLFYRNGWFR